jgi:hypothetical protein
MTGMKTVIQVWFPLRARNRFIQNVLSIQVRLPLRAHKGIQVLLPLRALNKRVHLKQNVLSIEIWFPLRASNKVSITHYNRCWMLDMFMPPLFGLTVHHKRLRLLLEHHKVPLVTGWASLQPPHNRPLNRSSTEEDPGFIILPVTIAELLCNGDILGPTFGTQLIHMLSKLPFISEDLVFPATFPLTPGATGHCSSALTEYCHNCYFKSATRLPFQHFTFGS